MTTACVVIDAGSDRIRAGPCEASVPESIFPPIVGVPKGPFAGQHSQRMVGFDALSRRVWLSLKHAIDCGSYDHNLLPDVWNATFQHLHLKAAEQPLLLAARCFTRSCHYEKLTEHFFEQLSVPSLCLQNCEPLCLYSVARTTGVVIDSGARETTVIPCANGFPLLQGARNIGFGGCHITDLFHRAISCHGVEFTTSAEQPILIGMKESVLRTSPKAYYLGMFETAVDTIYELPDGSKVNIHDAGVYAAEAFFNPGMISIDEYSVAEIVQTCVRRCDVSLQPELLRNVVLVGGNCCVPGLQQRMTHELQNLHPAGTNVQVHVPDAIRGDWACWMGGTVLSSMSTFPLFCVSKQEYDECGYSLPRARWLLA